MTVKEAAVELGITVQRVRVLIAAGRLKARRVGPIWIISSKDLDNVRNRPNGRPRKVKT